MKLTIYTDESLTTAREVRDVPRMKIPYRTADAVLDMLADLDMDNMNEMAILGMVLRNKHHLTAVVRATFGLSEEDLAYIDVMELTDLAKEIVGFVVEKMAELGVDMGETGPNPQAQVQTTA